MDSKRNDPWEPFEEDVKENTFKKKKSIVYQMLVSNDCVFYEAMQKGVFMYKRTAKAQIRPHGCSGPNLFFMRNSGEHDICPANKSQITDNCKFFLAKHSWACYFLC